MSQQALRSHPCCVVFLNGRYDDDGFDRRVAATADLLVAADGGAARLLALGLRPALVVGDFDSLDAAAQRALSAQGVELVRHPVRKDQTDAELAVDEALRRGAREVLLTGGLGALDHTLGHVAVLRRLSARGVTAALVSAGVYATCVRSPWRGSLLGAQGARFSAAALGATATLSLRGFDYPLESYELRGDTALGLGNLVLAERASLEVDAGEVLLMVESDGLSVGVVPAAARGQATDEG